MKRITAMLTILLMTAEMAFGHVYTLFSDGMPDDAVVTIDGKEFRGLNAQGDQSIEMDNLTTDDITVSVGGGYAARVSVDNANYQVNIRFIQFFTPSADAKTEPTYPYLLHMPLAYLRKSGTNLTHTEKRSEADRFVFQESTQGQYYIYDQQAKMFIYYTTAANGSNATSTKESNVRMTGMRSGANTWQLLALSDETVAIVPGKVSKPNGSSPALNFTGGIANGCVLNLWRADDSNSAWEIIDPTVGSMACATTLYAEPGQPFMHKLVPNEGETVTYVDLTSTPTLTLRTDRTDVGNRYAYISGTAPTAEGDYTYTVHLQDGAGDQTQATVRLTVSSHLQSPRPMMAWLTWNWFARSISHAKMVAIAQGMQRLGLVDAGFNTIVLDDAWATPTQDKSALTYDPSKFPQGISGLKSALQKINANLRVGIYSDAGSMTCENYQPGSYEYEAQHLALFDQWGVDMLKYDYCNSQASTRISYSRMGQAVADLNARRQQSGTIPFSFNICEWGKTSPWLWGAEAGGCSWRSTSDAREDWVGNNSRPGVLAGVDEERNLWMYAGVNRYNDLDMMCIGLHGLGGPSNNTMNHMQNGGTITGLTDAQARSQMSLWCMMASPLALTCDLRSNPRGEANSGVTLPSPLITDADVATLTNRAILAINQDTLGQQAEYMAHLSTGVMYQAQGYDVFVKDLTRGRIAVSITNRGGTTQSSIDLPLDQLYLRATEPYDCHDVWTDTRSTVTDTLYTGSLAPYETRVFVLTPLTDGITAPRISSAAPIYDLQGRPAHDTTRGVVIQHGRKRLR